MASEESSGTTQPSSYDTSLNVSRSGTSGRSVSTDLRHTDKAGRIGSSGSSSAPGAALHDAAPAMQDDSGGDVPLEDVAILQYRQLSQRTHQGLWTGGVDSP